MPTKENYINEKSAWVWHFYEQDIFQIGGICLFVGFHNKVQLFGSFVNICKCSRFGFIGCYAKYNDLWPRDDDLIWRSERML